MYIEINPICILCIQIDTTMYTNQYNMYIVYKSILCILCIQINTMYTQIENVLAMLRVYPKHTRITGPHHSN